MKPLALLGNSLVQGILILLICFIIFIWIRPPIPSSLLIFYMAMVLMGVGVFVTSTNARIESFWAPIRFLLVNDRLVPLRWIVMIIIPLIVGFVTYLNMLPSNSAPIALRVIHPAPPETIRFEGKEIHLREAENPLREAKETHPEEYAEHVEKGREVYYQNCYFCHGDHLAGKGPFAKSFNPKPADFQDIGTIAQLQESYLFWRIAKGGPGLPNESWPGRSVMPRWEGMLSENEIWSVILFLYEKTGHPPRTWE